MAQHGIHWRHTPPGGEIGEEEKPRAGLSFDTPLPGGCPAPSSAGGGNIRPVEHWSCGTEPSGKRD